METKKNIQQKRAGKLFGFGLGTGLASAHSTSGQLVVFNFFAPNAFGVSVGGSFNNWMPGQLRLERDGLGMWRGNIRLQPGIYQYRFIVNGKWMDDPNAKKTALNEFGTKNAVLEVK